MIEFCTKKRMLLACGLLISVSVAVLVIEAYLESDTDLMADLSRQDNLDANLCDMDEEMKIVEECQECSQFEKKLKDHCNSTGYRFSYQCIPASPTSNAVIHYKSCPKMVWLEEREFFIFEGVTAIVGALAYGVVYIRQRKLDKSLLEKINRQIAAGV